MNHLAATDCAPPSGHPGINRKGDPRIIAELEEARRRNRNNDNPNMRLGRRMFFDFEAGCVRIAEPA